MLIYGGGPRVGEAVVLRIQDVDSATRTLRIMEGKNDKYRMTLIPDCLIEPLKQYISWRKTQWEKDVAQGAGLVELPHQLAKKYKNEIGRAHV